MAKPVQESSEDSASRVVEAVGSAGAGGNTISAEVMEKVMSDAVMDCAKKGISDPELIREAKLAARKEYKAAVAKAEAERIAAEAAAREAREGK